MKETLSSKIDAIHQRLASRTAMARRRAYQAAIDRKVAVETSEERTQDEAKETAAPAPTKAKR